MDRLGRTVVAIEPLLPEPGPKVVEGRPRVPDRRALCGILFVLHTGIQWEYLPQELGFGSGVTCRRRPAAWNEVGVRDELHLVLLKKLRAAKKPDWSRAVIDSSHVRAAPAAARKRSQPGRPRTAGQQAPRPHRRPGHPAHGVADRRQPQRRHPTPAPARQGPGSRRCRRPPAPASAQAASSGVRVGYIQVKWWGAVRGCSSGSPGTPRVPRCFPRVRGRTA